MPDPGGESGRKVEHRSHVPASVPALFWLRTRTHERRKRVPPAGIAAEFGLWQAA
jgi:hypothetical protein